MSAKPPNGFQKDHNRNYMSAEKILTRWGGKKKKIEETYLVMAENPYNLKCSPPVPALGHSPQNTCGDKWTDFFRQINHISCQVIKISKPQLCVNVLLSGKGHSTSFHYSSFFLPQTLEDMKIMAFLIDLI